jgi:hypothetical protein
MKVVSYPALLVALLLAAAAPAQDPSYFPLKEGHTWTYRVIGGKESKAPVVMKVAGFEKVGDDRCARLEMRRDKDLITTELFTVRKDGVYRVEFGGTRITPPVCLLKLPLKSGENWKVDSKIGERDFKAVFVAGTEKLKLTADVGGKKTEISDTVTVTIKDLKVEGQALTTTYYFAEKIGMVKQVVDVGGTRIELELEKFEEGKAK